MFTIKAIRNDCNLRHGYEAMGYTVDEVGNSLTFCPPVGEQVTLYANTFNYDRIIVENAAGKTVENLVTSKLPSGEPELASAKR